MDLQIKKLFEQKLEALAHEQDGEVMAKVTTAWKNARPGHINGVWVGEMTKDVQAACHTAIVERGRRVAAMFAETLRTLKVPYEDGLSAELGTLLDPIFPEDLYLAPMTNTPGVIERSGALHNFSEYRFDLYLSTAYVGCINLARDARAKAQLVIDEYALSARPGTTTTEKGWLARVWEATNLRPGAFGVGVDLKQLFSRKPPAP